MKKQLCFKSITLAILFVLFSGIANSQNYEATKSLNKNASVSGNAIIIMSNYSGDLKITTSDANAVKIVTTVKISGKSKEDVDKVIKAIENFKFESSANSVEIDTRFYKNMQSVNNRRTITLKDGSKAKIREFEVNHELQIPETAQLELSNKYSDIEMQKLLGKASFDLYSTKLNTENISNDVKIEAKYSKIYLKEITGELDVDIYDTDVEFISGGDMVVKSKYSKIEAKKVGSLILNSYDDKFYIDQLESLKMNSKYSDFKSEANLTNLKLELYDCNIEVNSAENVSFNGKYSDLILGDVSILKIDDSYDNNITFGETRKIEFGKSKYSKYILESNSSFSIDDSYDDDIVIKKLNTDFSGITLTGKYTKLNVTAGVVPFKVDGKMKYGKMDMPESVKAIRHIEKGGNLELTAGESGGTILIRGYDNTIAIK